MKEKDFQTRFGKWLRYVYKKTGAYELKLTKTDSIAFNRLEEHQKQALLSAKHSCQYFKIPDMQFGCLPYDCYMLCNQPAYVVIMYYVRGQKKFYMLDIDVWVTEEETSKRKSLTLSRCQEIASFEGSLS